MKVYCDTIDTLYLARSHLLPNIITIVHTIRQFGNSHNWYVPEYITAMLQCPLKNK